MDIKHENDILQEHLTILKELSLSDKEYIYRLNKLKANMSKSIVLNEIQKDFFSVSHEIRSAHWFQNLCSSSRLLEDSSFEPGVDIIYKNYLIECVCATKGDEVSQKRFFEMQKIVDNERDYTSIRKFIVLRVLSVLYDKVQKYKRDIEKQVVKKDLPFILFLSFGELNQSWHDNEDGGEALYFLIGAGDYTVTYDITEPNKPVIFRRSYDPIIMKNKDAIIVKNFFGNPDNDCVSAVFIAYSSIEERYTNEKLVMYCNPYALNPINKEDFPNIIIWSEEREGSQSYIAKRNGTIIESKDIIIR